MKKNPPNLPPTERRKPSGARGQDALPDFRDLIENSVQGILVHRNFKPLYVNEAFARLFGYSSAQEILDLPLLRPLVPNDMWPRIEKAYDDLLRSNAKSSITRARGILKDGREIWTSVTERVVDWHGTPAVQINAFDISHQMSLEQNLLKNEQRLRAVLEILPYPIYIARRSDSQLLFVNRKTCLLLQQTASQLLRSHSVDFFVDSQERDNLRLLLDTISDIRDIEINMKTGQGHTFTAEIAAIAMDYDNTPAILVALNDISQRKQLENELFHQASTDMLTGINNRRYFMTLADQELRRTHRFSRPLAAMMIDIDHFKPINDQHGHAMGDSVLQGVVKRILESLRQSDQCGRLGGEEFAVLLPETTLAAATLVAERMRQHLAERPLIATGGGVAATIPCTISIGVTQLKAEDGSVDQFLNRADKALYLAKSNGRNRVEVAE